MIKPSTTRVLSCLLALGVASAALDGVVLAPSALSRSRSAVELRLRRSPGRVDVVIAGLGTEVRAVSQDKSDGRWSIKEGDTYSTSMAILILGVPYRFLPIYQR